MNSTVITRSGLSIEGRRLSYLDFGGPGRPLVTLHGHLSEGASFADLAARLRPTWRVIAPDQRGHGDSDRAGDYGRGGYVADLLALMDHMDIDRAPVLGHSLGAVNAYQFAARHPERITALIDVEGAAELGMHGPNPLAFALGLPYSAPTRQALVDALGPMAPMFAETLRRASDGSWHLPFVPADIVESEECVHGDHWADWRASTCPALLVRGTRGVIPPEQCARMVRLRPGSTLVELDTSHFVHTEDPAGFAEAVQEFLATRS